MLFLSADFRSIILHSADSSGKVPSQAAASKPAAYAHFLCVRVFSPISALAKDCFGSLRSRTRSSLT